MKKEKLSIPVLVFAEVDQIVYCPHGFCRHKEMFSNPGTFEIRCYSCDKEFVVEVRMTSDLF